MPDLDKKTIDFLTVKLTDYLNLSYPPTNIVFLAAGGSAAVFKVNTPNGIRAFKVFDPKFISSERNAADKKRLEIQKQLIKHSCKYLIQTYKVEEYSDTAIIEMEYTEWPQLSKKISDVPDDKIAALISQLVEAVKFLEHKGIVHRDIKPENIHISSDFSCLVLLDLGVAREIEFVDAGDTDHGGHRPFLATAQYSSPEYLFRLDPPSPRLWQGLNFYQVGAVLHDLIMKKQIFNEEMQLNNRWLIAKAVLTKRPSLTRSGSNTLNYLKILASRCLIKDLNTRLSVVSWSDFRFEGHVDPFQSLAGMLSKSSLLIEQIDENQNERIQFDRQEYCERIKNNVRDKLIPICQNNLPITAAVDQVRGNTLINFQFAIPRRKLKIYCASEHIWNDGLTTNTANIVIRAGIFHENESNLGDNIKKILSEETINISEDIYCEILAREIAVIVSVAIRTIEVNQHESGIIDFNECLKCDGYSRESS